MKFVFQIMGAAFLGMVIVNYANAPKHNPTAGGIDWAKVAATPAKEYMDTKCNAEYALVIQGKARNISSTCAKREERQCRITGGC